MQKISEKTFAYMKGCLIPPVDPCVKSVFVRVDSVLLMAFVETDFTFSSGLLEIFLDCSSGFFVEFDKKF